MDQKQVTLWETAVGKRKRREVSGYNVIPMFASYIQANSKNESPDVG